MKPIVRVVSTSFWEDPKVTTLFTPEDKYFMLYLLTNPHTTQLGIYQFVPKIAAFEMGYSTEAVTVLLDRFESKYKIIKFSKETSEVAIRNYLRYSVVKGGKPVMDCLLKDEAQVKDKSLLSYIYDSISNIDTLNITVKEYLEHISNINNNNDNDNERIVHESSTNRTTNRRYQKNEADDLFDNLWKMYPKKLGKGQVKDKQKKVILGIGYDEMSRCIERYKAQIGERETQEQYVMYGSTFFNSGYVDYLDENYESSDTNNFNVSTEVDDRWE